MYSMFASLRPQHRFPIRLAGSGCLDIAELTVVAKELGCQFSPNEMTAIFQMLDDDGNGQISFDEFAKWWLGAKVIDMSAQ